jgi:DNA-binding transcriptional regulator YhcF (GntR family)
MRPRTDVLSTLRERIVNGVHFGRLAEGDRLPSARQVAAELDADPRVVAAAYDTLARDGMVVRREGSRGYFVALGRTPAGDVAPSAEWLIEMLTQGIARGVPVARFVDHARQSLETVRLRTACVECNDDQVRWLCGELEDDYGLASHALEVGAMTARDVPSEVAEADLIVTTVAHAAEVRPFAERLGKPLVLVTLRPDVVAEVTRLLAAGPVYFLCTDVRFAGKLRALYRGVPHGDRVKPVVLGMRDAGDIPRGAPTWVMRTAREALGHVPAHLRELPTARIFSPETTRELLSHLVRANLAAASAVRAAVRA